MLKISKLAIGLPVIAQSRASRLDGFLENLANRRGKRGRSLDVVDVELVCRAVRPARRVHDDVGPPMGKGGHGR